eukprot:365267-Chlamydomonas_euryale.AAC.8
MGGSACTLRGDTVFVSWGKRRGNDSQASLACASQREAPLGFLLCEAADEHCQGIHAHTQCNTWDTHLDHDLAGAEAAQLDAATPRPARLGYACIECELFLAHTRARWPQQRPHRAAAQRHPALVSRPRRVRKAHAQLAQLQRDTEAVAQQHARYDMQRPAAAH